MWLLQRAGWLALAFVVLVCIACSMVFAFEFGWTRGATTLHRWAFAIVAAGLDAFKTALPILASHAIATAERGKAACAWAAFIFLTVMSLWCAYGTSSVQLAERMADQTAAKTSQSAEQATLDRVRAQRDAMPPFVETLPEAVQAAQAAVTAASGQADAERARGGCGDLCRRREGEERQARVELQRLQQNRAMSVKAADLDAKIEAAERALRAVDVRAATKEIDPQSASMAKAVGGDQDVIAAISQGVLAIAIEIGSGLGFWFLFHGAGAGRRPEPETASSAAPGRAQLEPDTPRQMLEHFFGAVARFSMNDRVQSVGMYAAFVQWCGDHRLEPMSHAMFGRLAQWPKAKIGGVVYYLDCDLAEGYASQIMRPEDLSRPNVSTRGALTTH